MIHDGLLELMGVFQRPGVTDWNFDMVTLVEPTSPLCSEGPAGLNTEPARWAFSRGIGFLNYFVLGRYAVAI